MMSRDTSRRTGLAGDRAARMQRPGAAAAYELARLRYEHCPPMYPSYEAIDERSVSRHRRERSATSETRVSGNSR